MKALKIIHSILGIIPFLWFMSFITILAIGMIKLGHVPKYGNPLDPTSLNMNVLSVFSFLCGLCAYISFYLWIGMSLILLFFRSNYSFHKLNTVLFFIGVGGFFVFKYLFPDVFAWVID